MTLNDIRNHSPCVDGWNKLLKSMNKTSADDTEVSLMYVLESNGIEDAIWCLTCFDYKEYCLFLADVAESVLHIYENEHDNDAPRKAINAIRDYHAGKIDLIELNTAATAADAAADAADDYAAAAAYAAYAAAYTVYAGSYAADAVAYAAAGGSSCDNITELFIKYFNKGEIECKKI